LVVFFGLAVAAVFLLSVGLAIVIRAMPLLGHDIQLIGLPAQLLLYILLFAVLWLIIEAKYGRPLWRSLGWAPSRIPEWQALLGGCLLSLAVGLLGVGLRTPQIKSPFDPFLHQPVWLVLFGVFAIFLGPVFEETVFRGFIQPLLTRDLGNLAGILLTAAAFGLLHAKEYSGAWQYVVLISFAGACFGWARVWGRSLAPAIYMHAGFNTVFFCAALFGTQHQK
jgi:uncharacterized protein